jgi:hypothetical protein
MEKGSVTLGGQRVSVTRPQARTLDGHEVPLNSYAHFAAEDMLTQVEMERMLAGVVALAITADGTKRPVGLWDGTENKTVVRALLADLVDRGLAFDDGLLVSRDSVLFTWRCCRRVGGCWFG